MIEFEVGGRKVQINNDEEGRFFLRVDGSAPIFLVKKEDGTLGLDENGFTLLVRECGEQLATHIYAKILNTETQAKLVGKEEPIILDHIQMIEDPRLTGLPVVVEGVVASSTVAYLVPKKLEIWVEREDGGVEILNEEIDADDSINLKLIGISEDAKRRRLERFLSKTGAIKEKAFRTIYMLKVRPPVFTLEKKNGRIVDEKGFEYKAIDVYVISDNPLSFQPSALLRLKAKPTPSPKTQKVVLLATAVEFPEDSLGFDVEKLRRLKEKLDSMPVRERVNWILTEFEKYSKIVKRRNLAFASFLAFFSPLYVTLDGETLRGWIIIMIIGDTTTAKTETVRKLIMLLGAGTLITGEVASQVGLTGTATQVEKEGWFVDWGFLVLCDRKLLAIDGAQKLSPSCWASLAEAERSGVVTIAKAAKNSAYARTRQIKIANPIDREAGRWATKPLADFLYPCQALPTVLDTTSIERLDLAVFSDFRDVKPEEVNKRMEEKHDPDLELLGEALKWCWSGKTKVKFTDEAIDEILESATKLYKMFHVHSIPLVDIDMKWKLARLSASLAYLTLSTDDFETVVVTADHVKEIVEFIKEEYSRAGLNAYAQQARFETLNYEDAVELLTRIKSKVSIGEEKLCAILRYIVVNGRSTRDELKAKFSLSEHNEIRPLLAVLRAEDLISARQGFYPKPKLIQAYKLTDGFTKPYKVDKFDNPKKEGGIKPKDGAESGGFFSDLVKVVNLVKEGSRIPEPNDALQEKEQNSSSFDEKEQSLSSLSAKEGNARPFEESDLSDVKTILKDFRQEEKDEHRDYPSSEASTDPKTEDRESSINGEKMDRNEGQGLHQPLNVIDFLHGFKLMKCPYCEFYVASERDMEGHMKWHKGGGK